MKPNQCSQQWSLYFSIESDPENEKDFVDVLYSDGPFLRSLERALSNNGVLVSQVGESSTIDSAAEDHSKNRNRAKFFQSLIACGFESVRDYEEVSTVNGQ